MSVRHTMTGFAAGRSDLSDSVHSELCQDTGDRRGIASTAPALHRADCRAGAGLCALLLALGLLAGCTVDSGDDLAGAQDFPNSLAPMGALAVKMIDLSSNWNQFGSVGSIDEFPEHLPIQPPGLTKRRGAAAQVDSLWWDLTDTALGRATRYVLYNDGLTRRSDTAVVWYDSLVGDTVRENETVISLRGFTSLTVLGLYLQYRTSDNDTDGHLDRRDLLMRLTGADSSGAQVIVNDSPGPDRNFDTWDDNIQASLEYLHFSRSDTLTLDRLVDTDGDNNLQAGIDPSWRGYEYTRVEKGDSADPGVARFRIVAQGRIYMATGQTFAERFVLERDLINGRTERAWGGGNGPDSTCAPGDTAWLRLLYTFSESDTISRYGSLVRVLLSSSTVNTSDNKLLSFSADCALRYGVIADASMELAADPSSIAGVPAIGSFSMSANLRPSGSVSLAATSGVSIEGRFVDETGKCYSATWNGLGALVHAQECGDGLSQAAPSPLVPSGF